MTTGRSVINVNLPNCKDGEVLMEPIIDVDDLRKCDKDDHDVLKPQKQQQQQHQEESPMEEEPRFLQMKRDTTPVVDTSSSSAPQSLLSLTSREDKIVLVDRSSQVTAQQAVLPVEKQHHPSGADHDSNNSDDDDWYTYSSWKKNLQDRLYRRPTEEAKLERIFEQCLVQSEATLLSDSTVSVDNNNINNKKHFTLISGPPGSGTARLARNALEKKATSSGGYFITGKFGPRLLAPYQAYISAMTEFVHLVLQRGDQATREVVCAIRQALGNEVDDLVNMIPALNKILSTSAMPPNKNEQHQHSLDKDTAVSCRARQSGVLKRFLCAFQVLLRAVATRDRPLVLLLDGLQHADQCSLDLLVMILTDTTRNPAASSSGLVLVGTCDDSVSPESYLANKLREIEDVGNVTIDAISLPNLPMGQVRQVLSEIFALETAACDNLATIVHEQTRGNHFYTYVNVCQFVDLRILVMDGKTGSWTWDQQLYTMVRNSISSDLQEFISKQLQKYPTDMVDVLKVASCFGSEINEQLTSFVLGHSVEAQLKAAETRGILVYGKGCSCYFFADDIIQDAIDQLTPEEDRELFHLEVGRRLWRQLDSEQLDRNIYIVLSQMRLGCRLISREKELVGIASLCLHAGSKAAESSSFGIAGVYLTFGIDLLRDVSWRDQYDLLLALHNASAEMLMHSANFEQMDEIIDAVIRHARVYDDKLQVISTRIWALGVTGQQQESTDLGVETLKHLGVCFPSRLCQGKAYLEWKRIRKLLRGKSNEQLRRLPPLQDEKVLHALRILQFIQLQALVSRPQLAPFVLLKSIRLTLENGISALAPLSFCSYAVICMKFNRTEDAFRFAELALVMLKQLEAVEYLPRVYVYVYGFIYGWKKDLRDSLEPLLKAQRVGIQTGDLEFSSVAAGMYLVNSVESGHSLQVILREAFLYRKTLILARQETLLKIIQPNFEFLRRLTGSPGEPFDFDRAIDEAMQEDAVKVILTIRVWRMRLAYLFCEYDVAADQLESLEQMRRHIAPVHSHIGTELIGGLTRAVMIRRGKNRRKHMRGLKMNMKQFRKFVFMAPGRASSKCFLLEAEFESIRGNNQKALEYYMNAILIGKGSDTVSDWALASEQAARHFLALGDVPSGVKHLNSACEAYQRWGASAKVAQLKNEIESFIRSNSYLRSDDLRNLQ